MQAYKLAGILDADGRLIADEPIPLPPGPVEILVWQPAPTERDANGAIGDVEGPGDRHKPTPEPERAGNGATSSTATGSIDYASRCKVKALADWFEGLEPAPPDFDVDQARWEALKEKHNL